MKVCVIGLRVIIINPTLANEINIDDLNPDLLTFEVGNILPSTVPWQSTRWRLQTGNRKLVIIRDVPDPDADIR
jgi:hypothetical protein